MLLTPPRKGAAADVIAALSDALASEAASEAVLQLEVSGSISEIFKADVNSTVRPTRLDDSRQTGLWSLKTAL